MECWELNPDPSQVDRMEGKRPTVVLSLRPVIWIISCMALIQTRSPRVGDTTPQMILQLAPEQLPRIQGPEKTKTMVNDDLLEK